MGAIDPVRWSFRLRRSCSEFGAFSDPTLQTATKRFKMRVYDLARPYERWDSVMSGLGPIIRWPWCCKGGSAASKCCGHMAGVIRSGAAGTGVPDSQSKKVLFLFLQFLISEDRRSIWYRPLPELRILSYGTWTE